AKLAHFSLPPADRMVRSVRRPLPSALELVQGLGPALLEEAGERAIGQQLAAGLAAGAVVGLVLGVDDALDRRAADRARRSVFSVHGHLGAERGDVLGEALARLGPQPLGPLGQDLLHRPMQR